MGEARKRGERRGRERGVQTLREPLICGEIDARQTRPAGSSEHASQGKKMIVLTLIPHPVPAIATQQVRDESCVSFNDALRQLFVLEPYGDRGKRRIVPRLPV